MTIEVKVPMLPESVADATIATWHKKAGDAVSRDENIVDLETDKVMLEVPAPADGILKEIIVPSGGVVQANQVIAVIEAGCSSNESCAGRRNRGSGCKSGSCRNECRSSGFCCESFRTPCSGRA